MTDDLGCNKLSIFADNNMIRFQYHFWRI